MGVDCGGDRRAGAGGQAPILARLRVGPACHGVPQVVAWEESGRREGARALAEVGPSHVPVRRTRFEPDLVAVAGGRPLLALVILGDGGIGRDLQHHTTAGVASAGGEGLVAALGGGGGGGRRARCRGSNGARARTDGRPRQLVPLPVRGGEGFVALLGAEQAHGVAVALEDHPGLGDLVPRHVRRGLIIRHGAPTLVGQGAYGA